MIQIVCLGSSNADYNSLSWRIAREYNSRIVNDIEVGLKNWENLNRSIDPICWAFAKTIVSPSDFVPLSDAQHSDSVSICADFSEPNDFPDQSEYFPLKDHNDSVSLNEYYEPNEVEGYIAGQKICTSWNVFYRNGCQFEYLNPGKSCQYIHHCSICQANGINFSPHKAWQCFNVL